MGGQKSLCVSLSALRLRSAVHSRQHVVCPAVWPVPGRTWGSNAKTQYRLEIKGVYCVFALDPYPHLHFVGVYDTLCVVEKIILFSSTMKIKLFSKKISMKFSIIFLIKKIMRKEWFFSYFYEKFIAHFFFKKKI